MKLPNRFYLYFVGGLSLFIAGAIVANPTDLKSENQKLQNQILSFDSAYEAKAEKEAAKSKELNDKVWSLKQEVSRLEKEKQQVISDSQKLKTELESVKTKLSEQQHQKQSQAVVESSEPTSAPAPSNSGGFVSGSCSDLANRGLSNFTPGDPNYTSARDRDNDGVACE